MKSETEIVAEIDRRILHERTMRENDLAIHSTDILGMAARLQQQSALQSLRDWITKENGNAEND